MDNSHRSFLGFLVRFLLLFAILNYGTYFFIGLAAPGNYYIEFFDRYLDYPEALTKSLLWGCRSLYSLFGVATEVRDYDQLWIRGGSGVLLAYDCLGYGVLSFWAAYIITNKGSFKLKLSWLTGGWFVLWLINVIRISLYLKSVNEKWSMPFGIDHHTWFNIASYACIFIMILLFERRSGKSAPEKKDAHISPETASLQ